MKLTEFLPGTVVAHNILCEDVNKNRLSTVLAIVPPKNCIINKVLQAKNDGSPEKCLLGIDAEGDVCFSIYANPDDKWYIPQGVYAMQVRCKLLNAGFKIEKDGVDMDYNSCVRAVYLRDIKTQKGQPVYIQGFKYFDKVLTRTNSKTVWCCNFYSHYDPDTQTHYVLGGVPVRECIPFEGNESLINTKQNPK